MRRPVRSWEARAPVYARAAAEHPAAHAQGRQSPFGRLAARPERRERSLGHGDRPLSQRALRDQLGIPFEEGRYRREHAHAESGLAAGDAALGAAQALRQRDAVDRDEPAPVLDSGAKRRRRREGGQAVGGAAGGADQGLTLGQGGAGESALHGALRGRNADTARDFTIGERSRHGSPPRPSRAGAPRSIRSGRSRPRRRPSARPQAR